MLPPLQRTWQCGLLSGVHRWVVSNGCPKFSARTRARDWQNCRVPVSRVPVCRVPACEVKWVVPCMRSALGLQMWHRHAMERILWKAAAEDSGLDWLCDSTVGCPKVRAGCAVWCCTLNRNLWKTDSDCLVVCAFVPRPLHHARTHHSAGNPLRFVSCNREGVVSVWRKDAKECTASAGATQVCPLPPPRCSQPRFPWTL